MQKRIVPYVFNFLQIKLDTQVFEKKFITPWFLK